MTTIEGIIIYEPEHYTNLDDLIDANNIVAARVNYLRTIKNKKYEAEKKDLVELWRNFEEAIKAKRRELRKIEKAEKEQKKREEEDRRQSKILLRREEYNKNLTDAIHAKTEIVNFETARNEFLILREFQKLNERHNLTEYDVHFADSGTRMESILSAKWVDLLGKKYTFDEITQKIESLNKTIANANCPRGPHCRYLGDYELGLCEICGKMDYDVRGN